MLAFDDAVWSAVMKAASYRCELAARFRGSRQLSARRCGGINYAEGVGPLKFYLSELLMEVNLLLSFPPNPFTKR
jgi:hypothetical protein